MVRAFAFLVNAALSSAGALGAGFGFFAGFGAALPPDSLRLAAFRTYAVSTRRDGSWLILVSRPNCPMAEPDWSSRLSTTLDPFQKPKPACCLNAAMKQRLPRWTNIGMPHLIASCTSGQAAWTTVRRWLRIGRAKGAASLM